MTLNETAKFEIIVACTLIILSVAFYTAAGSLPPPRFEPLGSAAVPRTLSVIMVVLCTVMLVRAFSNIQKPIQEDHEVGAEQTGEVLSKSKPKLSAMVFIATVCFIAAMDSKLLSFPIAGIAYMTTILLLMNDFDLKKLPWVIGYSVMLVLFSYWIFTRFFFIDLP